MITDKEYEAEKKISSLPLKWYFVVHRSLTAHDRAEIRARGLVKATFKVCKISVVSLAVADAWYSLSVVRALW